MLIIGKVGIIELQSSESTMIYVRLELNKAITLC